MKTEGFLKIIDYSLIALSIASFAYSLISKSSFWGLVSNASFFSWLFVDLAYNYLTRNTTWLVLDIVFLILSIPSIAFTSSIPSIASVLRLIEPL